MAFEGANIYSLVAGYYPILSDDVATEYSQNRHTSQSTVVAPSIYMAGSTVRQPFLQGNKIMFTASSNYSIGQLSLQGESAMLDRYQPDFAVRAAQLQQQAQSVITDDIIMDEAERQAVINASGKSMEEMTQGGDVLFNTPELAGERAGGQAFDMYDPIRKVHINVTNQYLSDKGHGIYGSGGADLESKIKEINKRFEGKDKDENQKYKLIVNEGIEYFKKRAAQTWNPMIRHAREIINKGIIPMNRGKNALSRARQRSRQMRGVMGSFSTEGFNAVADMQSGWSNFASESSRTMLKQHLGNPGAMYGNGVMETYVIGPYTYGEFGPFMMHKDGARQYEYKVDRIGGNHFQNYFATSVSRGITNNTFDAEMDARLRQASYITKIHRGTSDAAAVGGMGAVAMGGLTTNAKRLYPEINIHNANKQFSDRIHGMMRSVRDLDSLESEAPELLEALEMNRHRYTNEYLGGKQVWAAPYIGITGQQYTSTKI